MINIIRENDKQWYIWNPENSKSAEIIKIQEYNVFSKYNARYRVDVRGATVKSLIGNFQTAKSIAFQNVR